MADTLIWIFRGSTTNIHASLEWIKAPVCAPLVHCMLGTRVSTGREVGSVTVVVVVRANFLHQFVVGAVEGDKDADDFERFGAEPGDVALGLLLVAGLGGIKVAKRVLGALLHLLVLYTTVEGL